MQPVLYPSRKNGSSISSSFPVDYRTLLEHVPAIAYSAAPVAPYPVLYVSPQVERMLGFTQDEWVAQPDLWVQRIHPDDREKVLAEVATARETGQGISVEYRMLASDGQVKHFRDDASLVRDSEGKPLALHGVMIDITDQRRVEDTLREAEAKLHEVMGRVHDVVFRQDLLLRYTAITSTPVSSIEKIVLGRTDYDLLPPGEADRLVSLKKQVIETGVAARLTLRIDFGDGERFYDVVYEALRNSAGVTEGLLGYARDITQLRGAVESLLSSETRFKMAAELASDLIYEWGIGSDRVEYLGDVDSRLGYGLGEFPRTVDGWAEAIHPEDRERVLSAFRRALDSGQPLCEEYRACRKDGSYLHWIDRGCRLRGKSGEPDRWVGVVTDVTERASAETHMRESEHRFRMLAEHAADMIYRVELFPSLRYSYVSPAAEVILGYSPDEFYADPTLQNRLVHPDDLAVLETLRGAPTGAPTPPFRAFHRDGRMVWLEQRNFPVRDEGGHVVAYEGIVRDVTERENAAITLRQSEEKYRSLFDSSLDTILVVDGTGRCVDANPAACVLTGYSREELTGKAFHDLVPPDPLANREELFTRLLETGQVASEFRVLCKGGSQKEVEFRVTRAGPGRYQAVMRDITDRKRSMEAILQSEERFRSIFNNAAVGVVVADSAGVIMNVNQAMCDFLGYGPEELIGKLDTILLSAEKEDPRRELREAFSRGTLEKLVLDRPFVRKDGQVVWGRLAVSLVRDEKGVPRHAVAVIEDITLRREVEAALKEATNTLSAVIRSAPVAIVLLDRDLSVKLWNSAAEKLFGWTAEEVTGRQLPTVPVDAWGNALLRRDAALAGQDVIDHELRGRRKDGTLIDVSLSIARVIDAAGYPIGMVSMYVDITGRKRTLRALSRSLDALRESMEGIIQAMAVITEVRDPYTAGHQKRVSQLAAAIAERMGLPEEQVEGVRWAGLVHDLGKIGIPAEILSKPGKLSDLEDGLVRTHARAGYDVLKGIRFPWPIAEVVLQHHERLDGSGYPGGTRGADIPLAARILAVADVVEAMASHRPYRPALGLDSALAEIQEGRGTLYDPKVVDACVHVFTSGVPIWE